MYIEKIKWLDKDSKEAILEVINNDKSLVCFSCPCLYNVGDILTEPLECLDVYDVILCDKEENSIEKIDNVFKYKLKGSLTDIKNGIVNVYGFNIHIDKDKIPCDIKNKAFIQFTVTRIDVW